MMMTFHSDFFNESTPTGWTHHINFKNQSERNYGKEKVTEYIG